VSLSSRSRSHRPRAVIFGCAGTSLSPEEQDFFAKADPLGFILFKRNCQSAKQVRALTTQLREAVGRAEAPILIDQEGGRVARLGPPHWPPLPAARRFGEVAESDREKAKEAAKMHGRLIAHMLFKLGITVNCAPVCDVPVAGADDVIGDRAFSMDAEIVADLARAMGDGMMAGGVLPVIKHLPGHGRAMADSHKTLPVLDVSQDELTAVDCAPFRALADMPMGMVAHVVLTAVDPARPASTSPKVVQEIIRGPAIGFDGLLMCDDLSMGALSGGVGERAKAVLDAGVDIVLHCNGDMAEMAEVAEAVPGLTYIAAQRWARAQASRLIPGEIDADEMSDQLDWLLGVDPG
jgi:beta-N-acetylhexosaminidase